MNIHILLYDGEFNFVIIAAFLLSLGKGGFVEELDENDYKKRASIVFKLPNTTAEVMKFGPENLKLHLMYLKTYQNAGEW